MPDRYANRCKYEAICENSVQKFEMERYQLAERVDWLKSKITIGEIQEIEKFLEGELQREVGYEELIVEEDRGSLGDYKIEINVKATEA